MPLFEVSRGFLYIAGMKKISWIVALSACFVIFGFASVVSAETYYVSPAGSDTNDGISTSTPWQTLVKVNTGNYNAGDQIQLEGGATFSGNLYFDNLNSHGTSTAPVTLTSYGAGRATIAPTPATDGIFVYNAGGVVIDGINIVGTGPSSNTKAGVNFYNDLPGDTQLNYVRIKNMAVSGFGSYGVMVGSFNNVSGYSDVRIEYVTATNNTAGGIVTYSQAPYALHNVYIGHSIASDNLGSASQQGSGIIMGGVDGGVVERNTSHHNGLNCTSPSGPVGIFAYDSNNVVIQFNESYANYHTNRTDIPGSKSDGDGFDLGQNTTNSVVQYNYAHDNNGAGFLLDHGITTGGSNSNNTLRYNISQNDARVTPSYAGIQIWGKVTNTEVYNNSVYITPCAVTCSAVRVSNETIPNNDVSTVHFRNNILQTTGGVGFLVVTPDQVTGMSDLLFQGNDYYATSGAFNIVWNGVTYTGIPAWRTAVPLQETLNGANVSKTGNPQFVAAGKAGTVNNSDSLTTLSFYKLLSTSPMVGSALNLQSNFGINPGSADYFETSIPANTTFDIGASEYVAPVGGSNVLTNVGFESGSIMPWQNANLAGRAIVNTVFHAGGHSVEITANTASRNVMQEIQAFPAQSYVVSGWMKTQNLSGGGRMQAIWLNNAGGIIRTDTIATVTGTTNWIQGAKTLVAPALTTRLRVVFLTLAEPDGTGTAWFDDADVH